MDATLSLASDALSPEDLQGLTRSLTTTINRETDIEAKLPEGPGAAGARGEPITIGVIALSFLTSGAAVAMFNVLKSYFERSSSLKMTFERGGKRLAITAENVKDKHIERTMEMAREFFGESP